MTAVAVLGASGRVAIGSDEGKVAVADVMRVRRPPKWDYAEQRFRHVAHTTFKNAAFCCAVGPTQSVVLATFSTHSRRVSALATALDGKVLKNALVKRSAVSATRLMRLVHTHDEGVRSQAVVSVSWDGYMHVTAADSGQRSLRHGWEVPINCVSVHPDQQRVACGLWTGHCIVYDVLKHEQLFDLNISAHASVRAVAFSPSGRYRTVISAL